MYQFLFNELRTRANTVIDCHNLVNDPEQTKDAMRVLTHFVEALDTIFPIDEEEPCE